MTSQRKKARPHLSRFAFKHPSLLKSGKCGQTISAHVRRFKYTKMHKSPYFLLKLYHKSKGPIISSILRDPEDTPFTDPQLYLQGKMTTHPSIQSHHLDLESLVLFLFSQAFITMLPASEYMAVIPGLGTHQEQGAYAFCLHLPQYLTHREQRF